jgi:hypothetical protein
MARRRCSWPTLIFFPAVVLLLLPTFVKRGNLAEIYFLRAFTALLILRWTIAIVRGEQNRDWLFYVFLILAVPAAVYGLAGLFGS